MNNRAPEHLRKELKSNRELGLRRTQGHDKLDKLQLKSVKTEWGVKSFGFQAAQDWNNLPEDIREIRSVATFKRHLKLHFLHCKSKIVVLANYLVTTIA